MLLRYGQTYNSKSTDFHYSAGALLISDFTGAVVKHCWPNAEQQIASKSWFKRFLSNVNYSEAWFWLRDDCSISSITWSRKTETFHSCCKLFVFTYRSSMNCCWVRFCNLLIAYCVYVEQTHCQIRQIYFANQLTALGLLASACFFFSVPSRRHV